MLALINVLVKRIPVVVMLIAVMLLNGCKDSDKNSSLIFEALNESLERSNKKFNISSNTLLESLKSKVDDPASREISIKWLLVADSISSKANYLIGFIDSIKSNSKQNKTQIGKEISSDLYKRLTFFKEFVIKKNLDLKTRYDGDADILGKKIKDDVDFYQTYFLNDNIVKTSAILSKLVNDVVLVTNNMMSFCHNQITGPHFKFFEHFHIISATNGGVFKKGQEMSIQVGIGEFSTKSNPSYEINGMNIEPNDKGVGEYKMRINNKPGNYKAHLRVRYTETDGQEMNLEKDIEYSVIE